MRLLALVPLLLAFGGPRPASGATPPPPVASFSDVDGNVTVLRAGAELDAEEDMDLLQGDEIRTDAGAAATITFLDDHFVKLGERTTLTLRTLTANQTKGSFFGRVLLSTGRLFANFSKLTSPGTGFQVATRSAVAAVKGTTFAVEAEGEACTVAVSEGSVDTAGLDAQGREQAAVAVTEGQETTVADRAHRPTAPRAIGLRRRWVRAELEGLRAAGQRHRELRRSGDLHRLRSLRRRAREGALDPGADPEAREFLRRHPEERERIARSGERHRRIQERRHQRTERRQEHRRRK